MKRTKLFLTAYIHFARFQIFNICITHANLITSVGVVGIIISPTNNSILVYLPLTHVLEHIRVVDLVMIFVDMPCGYGRIETLIDASVQNSKEDISSFRPSIMIGVPVI